jgi:hypothetical protein
MVMLPPRIRNRLRSYYETDAHRENTVKSILSALVLLLFAAPAMAAPATPTIFDIEVLVFENQLPDLENGELWTREPGKPAVDAGEVTAAAETPAADAALFGAAAALSKDGHYRVLAHQHWQQPAEARSETRAVRVQVANVLDGTFKFYLARFLYLDVNLALQDSATAGKPEALTYRLNEHRRVKIQETHYFDHPKFGVLVRVTQLAKN